MAGRRKFRGTLQPDGSALGWTIVQVPFEPVDVWPQRKGLRVRGTINGCAFRTSLFRGSDGACVLLVNKQLQKRAGVTRGSVAEIVVEPDIEDRPAPATPPELERLLCQDRALRKFHDALSPSMRKWIADAVAQPKSGTARASRAELWAECLLLALEGERVPPPILEALFNRQPKARAGWLAMTPIQRRNQLLAIFYCQGPEARLKRAQRAVEQAVRLVEKKESKGKSAGRSEA